MARGKWQWWLLGGVAVVVVGTVTMVFFVWQWAQDTTTTPVNPAHQQYADAYLATWRSDDAVGEATMTATLLTPQMRTWLAADDQPSTTDGQILSKLIDIPTADVATVLTLDALQSSSAARVSDAMVQAAITMHAVAGGYTLGSFSPLTPPQVTTNTNTAPTTRRMWLVTWHPTASTAWELVRDLQLTVANIGGQEQRVFTWANPGLLGT